MKIPDDISDIDCERCLYPEGVSNSCMLRWPAGTATCFLKIPSEISTASIKSREKQNKMQNMEKKLYFTNSLASSECTHHII